MRASKKKPRETVWAPRSQKSLLRGLELEALREKCRKQIAFCERRIAEGREKSETQTATAAAGNYAIQRALSQTLEEIASKQRELSAYRQREKSLSAQIDVLAHPPARDKGARAKRQAQVAVLLVERYRRDGVAESKLLELVKVLQERAELTGKILGIAALLGFSATTDFDGARFAALADSLPTELLAKSRDWLDEFIGQGEGKQACTVGGAGAVLPETLADAGVYRPGETAWLSKQRAKLLPPNEEAKPLPGPVETEIAAGNTFETEGQKPTGEDSFPVSGFRMATSVL
jgi:hypothetical protein